MPFPPVRPPPLLLDDSRFDAHAPLGYHPERAERLIAARKAVQSTGFEWRQVAAVAATDDQLTRVHTPDHVAHLHQRSGLVGYLDADTYVVPGSADAALLAAGGAAALVAELLASPAETAMALVRPPGHHARPGAAMGFCLLNNVAVAAAEARTRGVPRVAIVDWDVHHGNGTQEIFFRDPNVLYISLHQSPFYPGTGTTEEVGEGDGTGFTLNIPLEAGATDAVYRSAFEELVLPVLAEFDAPLVLVSAGFDADARDPLAQMELTPPIYGWMAHELAKVARTSAGGKLGIVLEGGYDLRAIEEGITATAYGMVGMPGSAIPAKERTGDIDRAVRAAAAHWKSLR